MAISAVESNGKSEQTEALYRTHGAAVAALCWSLLRDRAEVEDATQQVFLSAHSALLNGTVPREPLAWLLSVARNECYARFRRRATAPVPAGEAPDGAVADASVHALRAGELASMWDEIGRMPPAQREAFLLREIRGLSYRQLADQLSLSPPSVRSLLLRARTRLRHRLGDVTAAVGGVPWVQALVRIVAGGDGTSPVPAATKAAAVGLGALVLAGGGALPHVAQHASATSPHPSAPHRVGEHVARVAQPVAVAAPPREDRSGHDDGSAGTSTEPENRAARGSGSNRPESPGGSDDGSDITPVAVLVAPPTTAGGGHDASGSSSPGAGSGSSSGSSGGSDGGGASGSGTGDTTTTTTAQSSSDGGYSGPDGGSGSGSDDGLPGG
jgi:RNA polymerase sigma-70 factor (ECF subfamily)